MIFFMAHVDPARRQSTYPLKAGKVPAVDRGERTMRFLVMVKATAASEAGEMPSEALLTAMGNYNEALVRAGVLLAAEGLDPEESVVVDFSGETPVVSDGPYGETKELFSGYYILEVASHQEAVEWAKRMPYTAHSKIEIRRVTRIDELPQDNPWVQNERTWRESTGQL
jgi:hypothetical protein